MALSRIGDVICKIFLKRFSGAVFRSKPETYLLKLQSMGLRNLNVAISQLKDAGDVEERACVLMIRSVFLWFFLTDLKKVVMRVW